MRIVDGCENIPKVRALFIEYAQSLGFDLCFQGFDAESAELPGKYAAPSGGLLLVLDGEEPVGCVALRKHDAFTAELKRLWVRPPYRGRGYARQLLESALTLARAAGYSSVMLDSHRHMTAAISLYESAGFRPTAPYADVPLPDVVFYRIELDASPFQQ
jgi:ribosomal protein S18 acetylase RimI-like enzyme